MYTDYCERKYGMESRVKRKIVLEDGTEYYGEGFGDVTVDRVCELVFNTAMAGYQEVISDPAYAQKMVVMTYPLIGNYGMADEDFETRIPDIAALITREYNDYPSNFRYTKTLSETLEESEVPGLSGVDTRKLTRRIRDKGSCRALITNAETPLEEALATIAATPIPETPVPFVSCRKRWYSRTSNHVHNVVAIDLGIKLNIIRCLNSRACNVVIMPWNSTAEDILAARPDGVVISNGPGCPEELPEVVETLKNLQGKVPMMGIGLGHELICRSYGAETYRLKCGRCGSHPIKNVETGKVYSACHNHTHAVSADSLEDTKLEITYKAIHEDIVEGVKCDEDKVFSVQCNPESAPGPHDCEFMLDDFVSMIKKN